MKKRSLSEYRRKYKTSTHFFSVSFVAFFIAAALSLFAGLSSTPAFTFGILAIGVKIELTELSFLAARFYNVDLLYESEENIIEEEESPEETKG